jgi:hypothetical protein
LRDLSDFVSRVRRHESPSYSVLAGSSIAARRREPIEDRSAGSSSNADLCIRESCSVGSCDDVAFCHFGRRRARIGSADVRMRVRADDLRKFDRCENALSSKVNENVFSFPKMGRISCRNQKYESCGCSRAKDFLAFVMSSMIRAVNLAQWLASLVVDRAGSPVGFPLVRSRSVALKVALGGDKKNREGPVGERRSCLNLA